jgi:hypothetical protein
MGQVINVESERVGDTVVFTADRSITGQAGSSYAPGDDPTDDSGFAGQLAARLFAADDDLDHVWVASNTVVVRRTTGWRPSDIEAASSVLSEFFVFYANL